MGYFDEEYKKEIFDFLRKRFEFWCAEDLYYGSSDDNYASFEVLEDNLDEVATQLGADWWKYGMSKAVFYFKEFSNIVVKIPFHGVYDYEYDRDTCDFILNYTDEFNGAYIDENTSKFNRWDYCWVEKEIYETEIENSKYENMFAATDYIGTLFECPIYISQYVNGKEEKFKKCSDKSLESAKTLKHSLMAEGVYSQFSWEDIGFLIEHMGEEKTTHFLNFLADKKIEDLHNDNYMITKDNKFVIIDYSGFNF